MSDTLYYDLTDEDTLYYYTSGEDTKEYSTRDEDTLYYDNTRGENTLYYDSTRGERMVRNIRDNSFYPDSRPAGVRGITKNMLHFIHNVVSQPVIYKFV